METERWTTSVPCKNSGITTLNSVKSEMAGWVGDILKL